MITRANKSTTIVEPKSFTPIIAKKTEPYHLSDREEREQKEGNR
jgi:hypothetical protein